MEVEDAGFKVGGVDWARPKVAKRAKVVKRIMMTFMLAFQFPTESNTPYICVLIQNTQLFFQGLIFMMMNIHFLSRMKFIRSMYSN